MKIVKSLEDSCILIKNVIKVIEIKTLGVSLLRNMLKGKDVIRTGVGAIRADNYFWGKFLISLHPLTTFEMQKSHQNS